MSFFLLATDRVQIAWIYWMEEKYFPLSRTEEIPDMDRVAEDFVSQHPQSILMTRRHDGGIQASPVRVLLDESGTIVACTRRETAKAKNLTRDPRFALCVTTENWVGPWITIEGTVELVTLPEAIDPLREFYLMRDGQVAQADEFVAMMEAEGRLIVRFRVERTAGTALGASSSN